jgi:DNA-binding NarL/FixJ family response regulator
VNNPSHAKITPRDGQVLRMLVQGRSNREIAADLKMSPRVLKRSLHELFLEVLTRGLASTGSR